MTNSTGSLPWEGRFVAKPGVLKELDASTCVALPSKSEAVSEEVLAKLPKLFQPITIRGVTLKNRIVVAPMCMYSANRDGTASDYHFVHYGKMAMGGPGLMFIEAAGVMAEGRLTTNCCSIHTDDHIPGYKRIVDYAHAHGTAIAMQLAHSGRKGSTPPPFTGRAPTITSGPDSWQVVGPSAIPYEDDWATPKELTIDEMKAIQEKWVDAAKRCDAAGFDVIEIHAAHGYLFHNFLSPVSNTRTDEYGGNFDNRIRYLIETVEKVRAVWTKPLFVRLSATDYLESGGWTVDDTVEVSRRLKDVGADVIDVSSGGNKGAVFMDIGPGYQVPFAERVKKEAGILTEAVGLITNAVQAEQILQEGKADLIGVARQMLRDPSFPLTAAIDLGLKPHDIPQLNWGSNGSLRR